MGTESVFGDNINVDDLWRTMMQLHVRYALHTARDVIKADDTPSIFQRNKLAVTAIDPLKRRKTQSNAGKFAGG